VVAFVSDVNNGGTGCTASPYIVTRTYSITDACGNTSTVTQTITVIDNTIPAVSGCPSDITVNNSAGTCGAAVTWTTPAFTDNCGSPVVVSSHSSGDIFTAGTTLVTYTATDNCGNIATCSFNVTLNDNDLPTVTCPSNITQPSDAAQTTSSVTIPDASANDNCSATLLTWVMTGATTASSPVSGINQIGVFTFNEGITTVTYTASDAAGNNGTCSFTVTILPSALPLSGSITSQTDIACFGASTGSITVTGSEGIPPYEYSLNAGPYQSSGTFSTLAAGSYTVTIRDASLNTFDISVTITQPSSPVSGTITAQTNNICANGTSGSVTIAGSGGVAPYRYKTGTGSYQTSGTISNLAAGTYTITVQDLNLCIFDILVTITEPAPIIPSITSQTNISCSGGSDGSVTVTATGGTSPFEFSKDDGSYQTSGTFNGLLPGIHNITIRDANLCASTIQITLSEPEVLSLSMSSTEASCPDEPDGTITITVTGGTEPYNYIWDDGTTAGDRTNLTEGSYSIVVTDANGCSVSGEIEVNVTGSDECIIVQEIITPNNDGFNDTWKIRNIHLFPDAEVLVYNRWGKLVFKTKNIADNEWDGTSDGKLLPTDSYHYILHLNNGSQPKSGVISIIR
jgi:gliding motility-associated-like protein